MGAQPKIRRIAPFVRRTERLPGPEVHTRTRVVLPVRGTYVFFDVEVREKSDKFLRWDLGGREVQAVALVKKARPDAAWTPFYLDADNVVRTIAGSRDQMRAARVAFREAGFHVETERRGRR